MPVNIDGRDRVVGMTRGSILRVTVSTNNPHSFTRNLTPEGSVETDDQMTKRVQEQVDTMRATLTAASEVRAATHHGSHVRRNSESCVGVPINTCTRCLVISQAAQDAASSSSSTPLACVRARRSSQAGQGGASGAGSRSCGTHARACGS